MSEQQELDQQEPAPAESREDELTGKVTRWVEGPLVTVVTLILLYYGGSQYGDSHYISHPLWQNILLWPVVAAGSVILVMDRSGRRPPKAERVPIRSFPKAERRAERVRRAMPHRRVSRWIARKIIARQERRKVAYLHHPQGR